MTNSTSQPTPTIVDQVRDFITSYVSLPDEAYADVLALYVLHTHAFNAARTTPYIYLTSQGPGSGKTRVLEVLNEVCKGSTIVAGLTGPSMFTLIEARKPTLMIDEVDTIYSGAKDEALRQVLNSRYKHNGKAIRVDKSRSATGLSLTRPPTGSPPRPSWKSLARTGNRSGHGSAPSESRAGPTRLTERTRRATCWRI